jgi:hypothetical protein
LGKMANRQVPLACQIVCYFWQLHVVFSTPWGWILRQRRTCQRMLTMLPQ